MFTFNLSLPEQLQEFVEQQVASGAYGSTSDYIHHLICQDQERIAQKRLEALLIEGLDSGEAIEVTDEWWEEKRAKLVEKLHQRQQ
jgi:antitoxin ParD1/3/4